MKDELISLETAKLASEKNFPQRLNLYYYIDGKIVAKPSEHLGSIFERFYEVYSAPTQSVLQRWLREAHGIHVQPVKSFHNKIYSVGKIPLETRLKEFPEHYNKPTSYAKCPGKFNSYEEALEAGLNKGLTLIK